MDLNGLNNSQKGDIMELFKSKKGIVTHPVMLFFAGIVIGIILTILWANGTINVPFPFCGK